MGGDAVKPSVRLWLGVLALVLIGWLVGERIHPGYVIFRPGPAFNTLGSVGQGPLIRVDGAPTYPTTGALSFTTVTMTGGPGFEIGLWDYLAARLDQHAEVRPRDEVFPPEATRETVSSLSKAQMTDSQQEAVAVALRATGHAVSERSTVREVIPSGPAVGLLREGDIIRTVAGKAITATAQIPALVRAQPAGQPVVFEVLRGGTPVSVSVPTRSIEGRQYVGVGLEATFTFPVQVTIDAGDVGGPSAGMMFALGVYDTLTPGPLTGGQSIAGTGTVDSSGAVGPIDSIANKMVGARSAGARWFLAPAANCDGVLGRIPDGLQVAKVATFAEAKAAVEVIAAGRGQELHGCS